MVVALVLALAAAMAHTKLAEVEEDMALTAVVAQSALKLSARPSLSACPSSFQSSSSCSSSPEVPSELPSLALAYATERRAPGPAQPLPHHHLFLARNVQIRQQSCEPTQHQPCTDALVASTN